MGSVGCVSWWEKQNMRDTGGSRSSNHDKTTALPLFVFYGGFSDEWERFSLPERLRVVRFLEELQKGYDDPEFWQKAEVERRDRYWAARIPETDFSVFWTLAYSENSLAQAAREIRVLAIEPLRH
jgi:hypothetical protein